MAIRPTDSELEILSILWETGPATVRQVHDVLGQQREVGYTTTLKLMQIMTEKGLVKRDESKRSHVYQARYKQTSTQRQLVKDLIAKAFGGSTEKLVMQALSSKKTTAEEIAEIREMLNRMEEENQS